jgi:ribonuclease P protein subunit RPR2
LSSNAKKIANQRIKVLIQQAKSVYSSNPKLSSRYIETARKIAMATRMRLPLIYKRQICKNCNTLLVQGDNCRVRLRQRREPHIVISCLNCGHKKRILIRKKREETKIEQDNYPNETPRQA